MLKYFIENNMGDAERAVNLYKENYAIAAAEEVAEFIKEVTKAERGKLRADKMAEEAAHVIISIFRYMVYNKMDYTDIVVDRLIDATVQRQLDRLFDLGFSIMSDTCCVKDCIALVVADVFTLCDKYGVSMDSIKINYVDTIKKIRDGVK